jgi:hypothetical protein
MKSSWPAPDTIWNKKGTIQTVLQGAAAIPLKELDDSANVQGDIRPIEGVLGEAKAILGNGRHAPPAEDFY